ncbi:MAG: Ig-like domain-containing protein [Myxococcales bacterium]|nr:Ig-like domain-containing protein [Myxococcales bacterium]
MTPIQRARDASIAWLCGGALMVACGSGLAGSDSATTSDGDTPTTSAGTGDATGSSSSDASSSSGSTGDELWLCPDGEPMPRPRGSVPNKPYPDELYNQPLSATLAFEHHNQPTMLDGYLLLAGNAAFSTWDISDAAAPVQLATFASKHGFFEAESHQVTLARVGDRFYAATISGHGVDIWELTDMTAPVHVSEQDIEGIDYGDIAAGVWGVAWQGSHLYVGGNDTGLHIVDVGDPAAPQVITTLPNSATGGFFVGPLFAMGNILVLTTPKEHGGVATMEISDPEHPVLLDALTLEESYIGWYYGGHVILQTPLRIYDVLGDPTAITTVLEGMETEKSEYVSFGDDQMFLGLLRPNPGAIRYDVSDLSAPVEIDKIEGRALIGNDDQFTLKVANLLVLSDDQETLEGHAGSFIAVESTAPDTTPPRVNGLWPPDGATAPATSSIGVSFSDQIELATVGPPSFQLRDQEGGCVPGSWGHMRTVLNFTPQEPLAPGTYQVVLPAGGITDLGGNAIAEDFVSEFTVP